VVPIAEYHSDRKIPKADSRQRRSASGIVFRGERYSSRPGTQCGRARRDLLGKHGRGARDRDQLWAEAVALYNAREPWWLTDEALLLEAHGQQDARYQDDPWHEFIANYCAAAAEDVSVAEILEAIGVERGRWGQADQNRVARCLVRLGWERYRKRLPSKMREWRYRRAGGPSPT
jgi:hypothetical protein